MKIRNTLVALVLVLVAIIPLFLSACSGGGGSDPATPTVLTDIQPNQPAATPGDAPVPPQGPAPMPGDVPVATGSETGSVNMNVTFIDPVMPKHRVLARSAAMELVQEFDGQTFLDELKWRVKNISLLFVPDGDWNRTVYYPFSLDPLEEKFPAFIPLNPGDWEIQVGGLTASWRHQPFEGKGSVVVEPGKTSQVDVAMRMLNAIATGIKIPDMPGEWNSPLGLSTGFNYPVAVYSTLASGSIWGEGLSAWVDTDGALRFSMPVRLGYETTGSDQAPVQVLDPVVAFRFEVRDDLGVTYSSPEYSLSPLRVLDSEDYWLLYEFPEQGTVEININWGVNPQPPPPPSGEKG